MSSELWEDPREEPGSSFRHRRPDKSDSFRPTTTDNSWRGRPRKSVWTRTWLRMDLMGVSEFMDVGKQPIIRSTGLSARDLRVLDPMLSHPSSITGRERAILLNLEHVKGIVTARDFWLLNPKDPLVTPFVEVLQRRVRDHYEAKEENAREGDTTEGGVDEEKEKLKNLPFEFVVLEACLETVCNCLDDEAKSMEVEAYPALDKLTSKVTTKTLDRVRQIKSRLAALTARVKQVRDLIEHLLENYDVMGDMYLTKKSLMRETNVEADPSHCGGIEDNEDNEDDEDEDEEDDDEDESPQPQTQEKVSAGEAGKAKSSNKHLEVMELEMILDAYFVQAEGANNKLSTLQDYVDNTEAYVNIMLDGRQNMMLKYMVLVATGSVMLNFQNLVTGFFGMNITIAFSNPPDRPITDFMYIVGFSVAAMFLFYFAAVAWYKHKRIV
ncbi:hypothetical protein MLD38_013436 [Melastoma candidum]|uniref:Uncharacterized protein n=1 Tax=Melastoma candidum TaxID=119954 RepID=A0ACB9R964_9MYRT|nr:hypothetical protein MLD38_013436 [Melastoma candidum]